MHRVIKSFEETHECYLFMEPKELWDGHLYFKITIEGWSDYGCATD